MSQGLVELTPAQFNAALESVLLPRLAAVLAGREAGHCMRVTDLDRELMVRLAGGLRAAVPAATVVVLADEALQTQAAELAVSSTKLVELRNPLPDNALRPPLLVFVPTDLRSCAEDSFGVATFEELSIQGAYAELIPTLLSQVPAQLRSPLEAAVNDLRQTNPPWPFADDASVVRFLLSAQVNEFDPAAIGAALFELALVPDFALLQSPERAPARVARNHDCVRRITWSTRSDRARALELELTDPAFCRQLGDFFDRAGLADPRDWTQQIVRDRANWPLAFNRWVFADGGVNPDSIYIGELELPDLPIIKDDESDPRLGEFVGSRVLPISKQGLKKFSVKFRGVPVPSRVAGLARFVAEVVSCDNGPTGLRRRKATWTTAKDSGTIAFSAIAKVDWEEGWHFVRVFAETEEGERIPLVDREGEPLRSSGDAANPSARPNESDLFYVLTDDDVEVEPPQRAVPRDPSLTHALLRARFAAVAQGRDPASVTIAGCGWVERPTRPGPRTRSGAGSASGARGNDTLEVRLGHEGKAHVLVPGVLAELERAFLIDPQMTNRLRLAVTAAGGCDRSDISFQWPESEETVRFRQARGAFFSALLQGPQQLLTQGSNLLELTQSARDYAGAYVEWLEALLARADSPEPGVVRAAFEELRRALTLDCVILVIEDYRGQRRDAVLLGPTHPLRANWHVTWAQLGQHWIEKAQLADPEFVVPTRDAVLKQLVPAGFPMVLPFGEELGRSALVVDNLTPFWSLYAAPDEEDPRGLIGDLCQALGIAEPAIGGTAIDGPYLAARVQRYLIQHPYVSTLTINAFNAGRAGALAEMLLAIQGRAEFSDLRYDIRLFVSDPDAPATGEALLELLSPDSGTAAKEADAFSTPTESHLRPKLRLAVRSLGEFRLDPEGHAAHLSFLFDLFPAEEIRAVDVQETDESSFVYGLVQPIATQYHEDDQSITWLRRPLHGVAQALAGVEELTDLLSSLARLVSVASASVARSQYLPQARPVVALSLSADERAMLHQVHEVSDWVMAIDRNLGIEFFDHRRHPTRPDYLIDHSPDMANAMTHRLAITSRSVAELEALLVPILRDYDLPDSGKHALVLLDQLRFLSGRLALKLLSAPTQQAEALGLALSRLFLEHQGVFQNQVVVPLDAHLELYGTLRQNAAELGDAVSFRRTDLALFDLDPFTRIITCRLVEVKCYSQVGDVGAYTQLKTGIGEQIAQTEQVISHHFDPARSEIDRPDRAIKNRDLAALLGFYLDRAQRHGVTLPEAAAEARWFLRHLDERGYGLRFTRSAVVFDFSKPGTEPPEHENGIEFYRIGIDLIRQLIDAAVEGTETTASLRAAPDGDATRELTQALVRRRSLAPSVPTLGTAAFLSPARDRTLGWTEAPRVSYPVSTKPAAAGISAPGRPTDAVVATPAPVVSALPGGVDTQPGAVVQKAEETDAAPVVAVPGVADAGELPLGEGDPSGELCVAYDVMLGATGATPQYGLLGEVSGRKVALDLNQTHTISLFGVQGGGKSYTLGSVAEMASLQIPGINTLPDPLATVIFHYSPTMDYRPEFTSMVAANSVEDQIRALRETYGAEPKALVDVLLLVPADKLDERRAEYPGIQVQPLQFAASELTATHWKFLMGALGNQANYIRQVMRIMKGMRDQITLAGLRAGIDAAPIPDHLKDMARSRLDLAAEYINDAQSLTEVVRPGRLIIVDLRDEFIEKNEALGLFLVLLQLFADARVDGRGFNKLVVFDEAHKYIESPDLVAGLVEVVREMRHKGVSIMVASQDPPSVPLSLIELSSQIILHKFNSPAWLKHLQKANAALSNLTPERMAQLKPGEAYVWSSKATDDSFSKGAVKIRCRPRVTEHGGATRVAVQDG